jgi:hypothetical protein
MGLRELIFVSFQQSVSTVVVINGGKLEITKVTWTIAACKKFMQSSMTVYRLSLAGDTLIFVIVSYNLRKVG